jgi:hypothetical protein
MSAALFDAINLSSGSLRAIGPFPLQVEYTMHAEAMMRRPASDRVRELPSATPSAPPADDLGDENRAALVETLGHRTREFPDANRLRPTHPAP